MPAKFKSRLALGEKLFATMVTLQTPATTEVLASLGFDWLFIDGEHGPLGISELQGILQAVGEKLACIVRVPEAAEVPIKQVLDLGAHGIIVPQVNTAEQAADVVRFAKYSPVGSRGVGLARAHGYGQTFQDYIEHANDRITVMVQAEHALAVENIESIVQVPGIDAIQLGPYDLSASMGKMGQIDDPEVTAAIDHIINTCTNAGLPIGCFGVSASSVESYLDRGCNLVTASVDSILLAQAASRVLKQLREYTS